MDPAQSDFTIPYIETLQRNHDISGIKHRILVVILNIETIDRDPVEQLQAQPINRHFGFEFVTEPTGQPLRCTILNRRQAQQQRDTYGQNDQREDDRRYAG